MQNDEASRNPRRALPLRPPPEEIAQNLEEYLPEHDVDQSTLVVGRGVVPPVPAATESGVAQRRVEHKKSIRAVAAEHGRMAHHNSPARRRTVKLWKGPAKEVEDETTQNDEQDQPAYSESENMLPSVSTLR